MSKRTVTAIGWMAYLTDKHAQTPGRPNARGWFDMWIGAFSTRKELIAEWGSAQWRRWHRKGWVRAVRVTITAEVDDE